MQSILPGRRLLSDTSRITHLFADPQGIRYTLPYYSGWVQ